MPRSFARRNNLTKETLIKLATAGCFIIAATSPHFLTNFLKLYFKDKLRRTAWRRAQKLKDLQKKKVVSFQELTDGFVKIELAHNGEILIRRYNLENLKIQKPVKWDKKWRLVIYDIPHYFKKARDAFRDKLKQLGLYQLQKSVWVSAYDCLPEIEFLCGVFDIDIDAHIVYITVPELSSNAVEKAKKWFNV